MSDLTIILQRISEGDEHAVADLYRFCYSDCLAIARRILMSEHLAEEAFQEAFLQFWVDIEDVDPDRALGLLKVLVRRRAIDSVRREERNRELTSADRMSAPDPADDLVTRDEAMVVLKAVMELEEPVRTAIILAFYGEQPYRLVAEIMGVPEGTAKWWIRTALARLERRLGGDAAGLEKPPSDRRARTNRGEGSQGTFRGEDFVGKGYRDRGA